MKRTHQQEGGACDVDVDVDVDVAWASLNSDLVRELAHAAAHTLPSLYLVSKHFHTALATASPSSEMWRRYFYSVPGYSTHTAAGLMTTWKDLVKRRSTLTPAYFLHTERARYVCGQWFPVHVQHVKWCPCNRDVDHNIVTWHDEIRPIKTLGSLQTIGLRLLRQVIFFPNINKEIVGCTGGMYGISRYFYDPAQSKILCRVDPDARKKREGRMVCAAAPAGDFRDAATNWRIEHFVKIY